MPLAAEKAVAGEGGELCLARVNRIHVVETRYEQALRGVAVSLDRVPMVAEVSAWLAAIAAMPSPDSYAYVGVVSMVLFQQI